MSLLTEYPLLVNLKYDMVNHNKPVKRHSTRSRILHLLLQSQDFLSGEQISRELELSRVAVWKAVQKLREEGHDIEASKIGYRLEESSRDVDLEAIAFSGEVFYHSISPSTMDDSRTLHEKGEKDFLVIAGQQSHGRGRNQRHWKSAPGGLFMTTGGHSSLPVAYSALLSVEILLRTVNYFRTQWDIPMEMKWPNDLYLQEKKVGGFLSEFHAAGERMESLSLGLGLNVNNAQKDQSGAISLQQFRFRDWNRTVLIEELARIQKESLNDLELGKGHFLTLSKKGMQRGKVSLNHSWKGTLNGTVEGLDRLGHILIRNTSGVHSVSPGECRKLKRI